MPYLNNAITYLVSVFEKDVRIYYSRMIIVESVKNGIVALMVTVLYMKAMRKLLAKMDLELRYGTEMTKLFPDADLTKE